MDDSRMTLLVDGHDFRTALERDLSLAQEQIYIQTLSFEGDQVGKRVAKAVASSKAKDIRIIVDSFMKWMLSDKFRYSPKTLFDPALRAETKATRHMFKNLKARGVKLRYGHLSQRPRLIPGNHKKLIVIDQRVAYIGGINLCEHNFAWHDMMLRINDPHVTGMIYEDFLSTWRGYNKYATRSFPGVTIHLLSGYTNIVAFRPILDLIDQAVESIVVESPYVTFPFWGRLKRARRRGLKVVVIIPSSNNRRFMTPYMVWEATRAGIEVWFCPKMTHLKGMLLDGKTMVMGSINFNVLGYLMNQEVVAVITDRDTVATFRDRVIAEDLRRSVKHK